MFKCYAPPLRSKNLIEFIGQSYRTVPVSYTHLDVYKRQKYLLAFFLGFVYDGRCDLFYTHFANLTSEPLFKPVFSARSAPKPAERRCV